MTRRSAPTSWTTPRRASSGCRSRSSRPRCPAGERERLSREGRSAVMEGAVAGYREFLDFYRKEYVPQARATLAAVGRCRTAAPTTSSRSAQYTTLDLTPEEIHKIGLAEVERISKEMDDGDAAGRLQGGLRRPSSSSCAPIRSSTPRRRRSCSSGRPSSPRRSTASSPREFGNLPRLPYTVEPVPDDIAPKYTSGRYVEAPQGSTQPGIFWVNTYQLESRPFYNLDRADAARGRAGAPPADRPQPRAQATCRTSAASPTSRPSAKAGGSTREWLGVEMGIYDDPYSNFGRLSYEMWRACRLVVDTGIHAKGWTREQAIDYMASTRCRSTRSRPRSTATSPGRARRSPTSSAS